MNVIAHGVDIVECARIARMHRDHAERFIERVYTPREAAYCLEHRDPVNRLSGRFAAKEAVMKMLGTGWRGKVQWTDIETLPDPLGRPVVTLHGETARLAELLGIDCVLISITHAAGVAMASAIGLAESPPPPPP